MMHCVAPPLMKLLLSFAMALVLVGCASSLEKTITHANTLPAKEQPSYLKSCLDSGKISQSDYDEMMAIWRKEMAERAEEAKLLASMTPAERAHYKLEKERLRF